MHSIFILGFLAASSIVPTISATPVETDLQKRGRGKGGSFPDYGDWTGDTSRWTDGYGTYVDSKDIYHYASGVKCWTDLFYADSEYVADNWERTDTSLDCRSTENCQIQTAESAQHCTGYTNTVSFDTEIETKVSVKLLAEAKWKVKGGYKHDWSDQQCTQAQASTQCRWNDQKCHTAWVSNVDVVVHAYYRRRCSSKNGDYTAWSHDIDFHHPSTETRMGCAATCDTESYPDAIPAA